MRMSKSFRFLRTFTGILLTAAVTIGSVAPVYASGTVVINDIDSSSAFAKESILNLANAGVIVGDENGNFNPRRAVKRADMMVMLVKALKIDTSNAPSTATFSDVPVNHWAFPYVEAAYKAGIVRGIAPGKFGPRNECTREQMAVFFVRALGLTDEALKGQQSMARFNTLKDRSLVSPWAKDYVEFAMYTGLMSGVGNNTFAPRKSAERQQVAIVTDKFMGQQEKIDRFARTFKGEFEHPELYQALGNSSSQYEGSAEMNLDMNFRDTTGTLLSGMHMGMTGLIDSAAESFDFNYDVSAQIGEMPPQTQKFRVIMIGDRGFIKYEDQENWIEEAQSQLGGGDLLNGNENSDTMLKYYRYYTVEKEESASIRGTTATKYTMTLSEEAIKAIMSETLGTMAGQGPEISAMKNPAGKTVIYLDGSNRVIYQKSDFTTGIRDEEMENDVVMEMILELYYSGIGQEVNIQAPVVSNPAQ